jgi:hypothetical protein
MIWLTTRVMLAVLLLGTAIGSWFASRLDAASNHVEFRAAVGQLLRERAQSVRTTNLGYAAKIDGCLEPIFVNVLSLSLFEAPGLERTIPHGYRFTFVYVGATQDQVEGLTLYLEWARQLFASYFGSGTHLPLKSALMISAPPGCDHLGEIEWSDAWRTDRLIAAPVGGDVHPNS